MQITPETRSGIASKYVAAVVVIVALAVVVAYSASQKSAPTSTSSSSSQASSSSSLTSSSSSVASSTSSATSSQGSSTSTTTTESSSSSSTSSTSSSSSSSSSTVTTSSGSGATPITVPAKPPTNNSASSVSVGYFANLNHGPAILGLWNGVFQQFVGPDTSIETTLFTSGSPEMTALLAGKIDVAFVGPDPAVNAYFTSNGTALQIVSGVANGGAVFVVSNSSGITSVKDLGGKTFAAPGVGNTQDIALRHYLQINGYTTTAQGGNVTIDDTSNANIVALMQKGQIDGAWVPEPWGAIMVAEDDAHIFLNEQSLWPNGFSTTEMVVASSYLKAHPDVVKELITANLYEIQWIQNNPQQAAVDLNDDLGNLTGGPIGLSIIQSAMTRLSFTDDPLADSVVQQAVNAYNLGDLGSVLPTSANLGGIYNLTLLNSVLAAHGLPQVSADAGSPATASPATAAGGNPLSAVAPVLRNSSRTPLLE